LSLKAPFKRTIRPFMSGEYLPSNGSWAYVRMPCYSTDPRLYIRGFLRLQSEVRKLFEFVYPSDGNVNTHSEHIGILLARACFEVETNLTAILRENGYTKSANWTMEDYRKIDQSHRLSCYEVRLPEWHGQQNILKPFEGWSKSNGSLNWYQSYNKYKHDRVLQIDKASFRNLIEAWCGLFTLLSAQYSVDEFSDEHKTNGFADITDPGGFWHGVGGYLKVKFPTNWSDAEKYDFQLTSESWTDPSFAQSFNY
jgi:hypothetical protein